MVPLEVCLFVLLLSFGMVGLSRTFPRELGATMGFVGLLMGFELLGARVGPVAERGLAVAGFAVTTDVAAWTLYTAAIAATVYMVYQGETLTFNTVAAPGPVGKVFDFAAGLFNGWLVIGTWWYYTDRLGYPIGSMGLYEGPLTSRAERLVELTPIAILPDERALVYLAAALVGMLLLKVAR